MSFAAAADLLDRAALLRSNTVDRPSSTTDWGRAVIQNAVFA